MTDKEKLTQAMAERVKEAGAFGTFWNALKKVAPRSLASGTALGTGALVIGGGAALAAAGTKAVADPIKRRVGRNRMYRENPFLQNEDKKTVNKYFNTLYRFSPTMAMDPLVSGSFMKKQLEFKDVGIQPTDIGTIANIEKAVRDRRGSSVLTDAFSPTAIKDMASAAGTTYLAEHKGSGLMGLP